VHQKFQRSNFVVVNCVWDMELAQKLAKHLLVLFYQRLTVISIVQEG
jgi:hypothetical protein